MMQRGKSEMQGLIIDEKEKGKKDTDVTLVLLLFFGLALALTRRGRAVLRLTLLVDLLEEAEGGLLGGADGLLDLFGSDGRVAGLALDGKFPELGDKLGDLLLLSGIELVLEVLHGYKIRIR